MSSFRIDRQYVTFEASDLHSADGMQKQTFNPSGYADPGRAEMDDYQRALFEQEKKKAEDNAKRILENADQKAESILQHARKTAAAIIKESQANAGSVLEAAKAEGYSQGKKEAQVDAAVRKKEEAEQLRSLADSMKTEYAKLLDGMHDDIIALVMEIAKKIIDVKLQKSDEVFMDLVNDAVGRLKQASNIIIHVCSEDYERYFGDDEAEKKIVGTNAKIAVVEEETYFPGDLIVESEGEALDLSISKQLEKVKIALSNEEK